MAEESGTGWDAVMIHPQDDVAVTLRDLSGSIRVRGGDGIFSVLLLTPIPLGHKFALHVIERGESVRKYGEPIGVATTRITVGEHVHVHNVKSDRALAAT